MTKNESQGPGNSANRIPAFSPLADTTNQLLKDLPALETHPQGWRLVRQYQVIDRVALLRSGVVKLIHANEDLDEHLVGLRSTGWWLGGTQCFLGLTSTYSVVTATECTVSYLSKADFVTRLASDLSLLQHFILAQSRELTIVQQHSLIQNQSAEDRLRYLLGESSQSIWQTIDPTLVLRQLDLAQLLQITPEHLSRLRGRRARHKDAPEEFDR